MYQEPPKSQLIDWRSRSVGIAIAALAATVTIWLWLGGAGLMLRILDIEDAAIARYDAAHPTPSETPAPAGSVGVRILPAR